SYVVYLGDHIHSAKESPLEEEEAYKRVTESHYDLLSSVLGDKKEAQDAIFYSYTKYINGFAAMLEEETANAIAKYPGVVSVFPNGGHKLHTTRSWKFMGLERDGAGAVAGDSLWTRARFGEDTIIANLDTGVWPESESFKDEGLGPIPSKWKGICQNDFDKSFSCN
ncbi:Subtilisin-like protease SBT5.3, partial [Ananas comosus]